MWIAILNTKNHPLFYSTLMIKKQTNKQTKTIIAEELVQILITIFYFY